jgi:hypothetical protein
MLVIWECETRNMAALNAVKVINHFGDEVMKVFEGRRDRRSSALGEFL